MLYNNNSGNHAHNHNDHCNTHCHDISHNHAHNQHDSCCSAEHSHSDGGSTHSNTQKSDFNDPPEEPERQSHNIEHSHQDSHDHVADKSDLCCGKQKIDIDETPEQPKLQNENIKLIWKISGMDCASCAKKIENALKPIPNIVSIKIIFSTEKLVIYVPKKDRSTLNAIENKIAELGYTSTFEDLQKPTSPVLQRSSFKNYFPIILLGVLIVISYLLFLWNQQVGEYAFNITALIGLFPIAKKALLLMRSGTPFAIESLMSVSAVGALFIGAAEEATMVIFLFMIGEMLEGIASSKAKKGISSLVDLMPENTVIIIDGKRQTIASNLLKPDDIIEISSGGRLPADVILISEQASIDTSALTGESIPVSYQQGDKIMAGSLVNDSTIQLKVVSEVGKNAVDRILQLIEEAEDRKAPIERFIDKFSNYYTPAIAIFSVFVVIIPPLFLGADWQTWIYRGLTLLLIGCPCALVISTPAVITSALSSAARHGVLIKGGAALEYISSVKTIAFDKTGTLTEGKPQVTDIINYGITKDKLIAIVASIESGSHHPLAKALIDYANSNNINFSEALDRKAIAGVGIQGKIENETIYIVSPSKVETVSASPQNDEKQAIYQLESNGKTVIVVVSQQKLLGIIALQDVLREETEKAIQELHQLGLQTIMLTGDNGRAAKAIANQLNIDYRTELLPSDKLIEIERIGKQTPIAMVGDGINDAPAMKAATVGIAMGSGSDVALETADAALTKNSLLSLASLIRLTRFAKRNIKQNITIALGLKLVFLFTSLVGLTGLWLAVLADSGATAIVTINALRLLKVKK